MKEKSKVELYERIRRDRRLEEASIRELARRHGVHLRTVRVGPWQQPFIDTLERLRAIRAPM